MVNDLQELLRANVEARPPEHLDLEAIMGAGRRRVRARRRTAQAAVALATAAVVALGVVVTGDGPGDRGAEPAVPPTPVGPTIHLADATRAVEGRDYELVASLSSPNLDAANGDTFEGMTDDGLVLVRHGANDDNGWHASYGLLDPDTGATTDLPDPGVGQEQAWPLELGADRIVLWGPDSSRSSGLEMPLVLYVLDRGTGAWSTVEPDLEPTGRTYGIGPDDRLYVGMTASRGAVPEGGWPKQDDGDAEDADAEGDTYALWSVSLTDPTDVRDEGMTVGSVAFTETALVWTDSTNGAAGQVHVRDLATGAEHAFDPHLGERCNLLSFGATGDRVVMGQYCGTYGDTRDDRVQVVSTDGEPVVTIQDSGFDGGLPDGNDVVSLDVYSGAEAGTYVYDLGTDRFLRVSEKVSNWGAGGISPTGTFFWHTPVNRRHGMEQWLGRLLG